MSKEQTPIELKLSIPIYNHLKWTISRLRYFNEFYPIDRQRIELIFSINEMFKNRHEESKEQYAQAKVLEALEEKSKTAESILETLNDMHSNDEINYDRYTYLFNKVASIQLDETEVKPNYE